jgi:putative transposase
MANVRKHHSAEHVYLQEIQTVQDAQSGLRQYFEFYNHERLHQSLSYRTPAQVYLTGTNPSEQQEVYQPAAILIQ